MCGIYGTIGKQYKNIEKIFSPLLHHRGPDDKGVFIDEKNKLSLGHSRLSIIDLSSQAHQPMIDESGNYVLVYNGEIYNYQDIKKELKKHGYKFATKSDSEVIIKSYIQWGEKCLVKFRGMFSFCIYDKVKNLLFLARDRFGIKPLIYTFSNNQFIFCSEIKPFLKSDLVKKEIDNIAVSEYFKYGAISQPRTILKNVYQLMPGHFLKVDFNFTYTITKYYNLFEESKKYKIIENYDEAVRTTRLLLEEATKYHMVADVEVGAFLSGGIDSTAVVAMMKQFSDKQINTFSVGFKDKTQIVDETDVASRTAKRLDTNHYNIMVDNKYIPNIFDHFIESIDQPSIDGINTFIISKETSKQMKVALSGLGGDEIFAGYPHFKTISKYANWNKNLFTNIGRRLNNIQPNRYTNIFEFIGKNEEICLDYQRSIHKNLYSIIQHPMNNDTIDILYEGLSSLQRISVGEINNYLLNTLLRDNDVLSMAHSLEVRPILLDHKFLEFSFNLKDEYKIRDGIQKAVFIDSVKDIIPSEVWKREKTGFDMPLKKWMNGVLNDRYKSVINYLKAQDLFHENYFTHLKNRIYNKNLKEVDWLSFIFLTWIEKYKNRILGIINLFLVSLLNKLVYIKKGYYYG